jgi:hypothetical protein
MCKITQGEWKAGGVSMLQETFIGPYVEIHSSGWLAPGLVAFVAGRTAEEAVANARLVASAPKLLDACKTAKEWLDKFSDDEPIWEEVPAADIATILHELIRGAEKGE